jgi:hypothetical protein
VGLSNVKMPILSTTDCHEMFELYTATRHQRFVAHCVNIFVRRMIDAVPPNIKDSLMNTIRHAENVGDMSVLHPNNFGYADVITLNGKSWPIYEIIHHSNALKRIAEAIGVNIRIRPHEVDEMTWLRIEYYPSPLYEFRMQEELEPEQEPESPIIHNPEDEYDGMPPLEL